MAKPIGPERALAALLCWLESLLPRVSAVLDGEAGLVQYGLRKEVGELMAAVAALRSDLRGKQESKQAAKASR